MIDSRRYPSPAPSASTLQVVADGAFAIASSLPSTDVTYLLRHLRARALDRGRYFSFDPPEVVAYDLEQAEQVMLSDPLFHPLFPHVPHDQF